MNKTVLSDWINTVLKRVISFPLTGHEHEHISCLLDLLDSNSGPRFDIITATVLNICNAEKKGFKPPRAVKSYCLHTRDPDQKQ